MRITSRITTIVMLCVATGLIGQNSEWDNYTNTNQIRSIESSGNTIWVGTHGGLVEIDTQSGLSSIYTMGNSGIPDNRVNALASGPDASLWVSFSDYWITWGPEYFYYYGGVAKYDGNSWIHYTTSNSGLPSNEIRAIETDTSGHLWAIYDPPEYSDPEGVVHFDGTNWTVYNASNSILPPELGPPLFGGSYLVVDGENNVWLGTGEGLFEYNGEEWVAYNSSNSELTSDVIGSLAASDSYGVWAETSMGLGHFDSLGWTFFDIGGPFTNILSIDIDTDGLVWVLLGPGYTPGGALAMYDGETWSIYDTTNTNVPAGRLNEIVVDDSGHVWLDSEDDYWSEIGDHLWCFDEGTFTEINTSFSGLYVNSISAVHADPLDRLWIAYEYSGTLSLFDGEQWSTHVCTVGGSSNYFYNMVGDQSGKLWIIGSYGLYTYDGINWVWYNTENSGLPRNAIRSLAIDELDQKWIGFFGGLVVYDNESWLVYDQTNSPLPDNSDIDIKIDQNDVKWIGTNQGLYRFDNTHWTVFNSSNSSMPGDEVWSIVVDSNGYKWVNVWGPGFTSTLLYYNDTEWFTVSDSINWWPLYADSFGRIWMVDDSELAWYDHDSSGAVNMGQIGSQVSFQALSIDNLGNIWLGTWRHGLFAYHGYGDIVKVAEEKWIPSDTRLFKAYPNPFNPTTTISYQLPALSHVSLRVYDITGRTITTLSDMHQPAGTYDTQWKGTDDSGNPVSTGVYFCRLQAGDFSKTIKMVYLK